MGKYSGGKAWLNAVTLTQDGKPVQGEPTTGDYVIALKSVLKLKGNHETVTDQLHEAFPGCAFSWAE